MSAGNDLVLDAALEAAGQDRFDHDAIATVVADLVRNAAPPINIALFGPWGSGKSSFFGLLQERLASSEVKVARYDAWKYGGRALKKHFVSSVAQQLGLGGDEFESSLAHDQEVARLDLWRWVVDNRKSFGVGLLLAFGVATVWYLAVSAVAWMLNQGPEYGFVDALKESISSVGPVLTVALAAVVFGPKVLETAVYKVKESAPQTDDEFAKSFQCLVEKATKGGGCKRLVVFIDELDRCSPKDVVATLIDLKTFLDAKDCVFIVAADREVLERALREVPQANPVRDEDPYYSTPGAFLDKVFQHQIPLPPLRPQAITRFARELVESQGGLWAELREAQSDERLFLRVVYGLVPVHVRSPRRVKVLLNNYATNVRIAQARGVDWIGRAEELAALTVLETEFPSVAADLIRFPALLRYLRDPHDAPLSTSAQAILASYVTSSEPEDDGSVDDGGQPDAEVAGGLLIDRKEDRNASRRANRTLLENLLAYLRRIDASGIEDPRPDLLFLQSVGANEGLGDPGLAEVIEFAADYSASDVVAKFAAQPSAVVGTAVRLLAQQAEAERGPGRMAITESVCRLTERLDREDAQAVAPVVAGAVLSEVNSPDWPAEATPGALILGVIGASKPLVEALLARQDADVMARSGVLGRVASVLAYAGEEQSRLVHTLLGSAYYLHPKPLHEALRGLPGDVARGLFDATLAEIQGAMEKMSTPPAAPVVSRTAASSSVKVEDPRPEDTAAQRFEALLASVEGRTDAASERLISDVLRFGQASDQSEVRDAASILAESSIDRIKDPVLRNIHGLLGLRFSPVEEAGWWADLLSGSEPFPDGYEVFERLVSSLAASEDVTTAEVEAAVLAVLPHVAKDEYSSAVHWLGLTLERTEWSIQSTIPTARNRAALYKVAEALRPQLSGADVDALIGAMVTDVASALDLSTEESHVAEMLAVVKAVPAEVASEIERQAAARDTADGGAVATLRVRLAAVRGSSTVEFCADDLLAIKGLDGADRAFDEWLPLRPPLVEVVQVLGRIKVSSKALIAYASELNVADRTDLWITLDSSSSGWPFATLGGIGKLGLGSAAIQHVAKGIEAATQQSQRDAFVDRLEAATLVERPSHGEATALILQLLATGVGGDVTLAARVAFLSGGVAYGKTMQVRSGFDAGLAARPKALNKSHQTRLQGMGLLSAPARSRRSGLLGIFGG